MVPTIPSLPSAGSSIANAERHLDVEELIEDYAWRMFKDMLGFKKSSSLDSFKHLERDEAQFTIVSLLHNINNRSSIHFFVYLLIVAKKKFFKQRLT